MNCQHLTQLIDNGKFSALSASERCDGEAHALSCRHCAPRWAVHSRLADMRMPAMPADLAVRCQALVAARAQQNNVLRFVPRRMFILASSFVVLAAAAGVLTVRFIAPLGKEAAQAPKEVTTQMVAVAAVSTPAAQPAAPPAVLPASPSLPRMQPAVPAPAASPVDRQFSQPDPIVHQAENGETDMNKSQSIAAAVIAAGAAMAAPAQTSIDEGRQASVAQIIESNDLNKDGVVTREEATTANKTMIKMWNFYDIDSDGRVDAREATTATQAMLVATAEEKITGEKSGGPAMVKPASAIETNDLNKDGVVTREEAMKVGKGLARLWGNYDLNKDGKVDAAEFARAQGY